MKDSQLSLQAAVTKTASFNSAVLDLGDGFAPGGGGMPVKGVVPVAAVDTTDTDETYSLKLEESSDNATFSAITPAVAVTAAGLYEAKGFLSQRYVRLVMTAAGTTPSITYGAAYLDPLTV